MKKCIKVQIYIKPSNLLRLRKGFSDGWGTETEDFAIEVTLIPIHREMKVEVIEDFKVTESNIAED